MTKTRFESLTILHARILRDMDKLGQLAAAEQKALDKLPPFMQESPKAAEMELAVVNILSAISALDEAEEYVAELLS